ncbi:sensor histidine kinase [Glutamicibacter sp. 287]|uniref:sensor histidine kinase n=1 Tax=Micrococcaceae TaxID=1268 RepID=UPI0020D0280F|nr:MULTISPECIES: histidine kinase [Micrococcaceae]
MNTWTAWTGEIKPLPGGRLGRFVPLALALFMYAGDVWLGTAGYLAELGVLYLAFPYLPLAALSLGVLPSIAAWFVGLLLIAAVGMPGVLLASMVFPSVFVIVLSCYLLPWRAALAFPSAAMGMLFLLYLLLPEVELLAVMLLCGFGVMSAVAGLSLNVYRRKNETSAKRIRDLEVEQARIRSEERTQLAHELHDIVAHDVTIMAMQARRAEFVNDPKKTAEILAGIGNAAQQTLQDLRSLVVLLKTEANENEFQSPSGLEAEEGQQILESDELSGETTTAVGLVHDLDKVMQALKRAGFDVAFALEGEVARIPASLRQALRRTIRELGTNILKHANPDGAVELQLRIRPDRVLLSSTNDIGQGTPIMSSQTGLEAMRARCEVFGGTVETSDSTGRWSIGVTIPLEGLPATG